MKKNLLLGLTGMSMLATNLYAQQAPQMCRNSEMMQHYYNAHPEAANERTTDKQYAANRSLANAISKSTAVDTYRVALVFHVYGTTQGGETVDNAVITAAVAKLNMDFHGLNSDYNTVHTSFMPLRSPKNIKFYLAKKDPNGNNTTGITYHPTASGFGNGTGYDALIQADAWDNHKYINVYVQNDLYNDGVTANSGVAWYPSTSMTNNNLARVVYNGAYLAYNTDPEFASVLTHEFGHFFDLLHTFEGGCALPNDEVLDTPPCTSAQGCHTTPNTNAPLNCFSTLLNAENYMDYNSGCYKMFTIGQAKRMDTALYMPSRITLWQDSTNIITGIDTPNITSVAMVNTEYTTNIFPNPTNGKVTIEAMGEQFSVTVMNAVGQTVAQGSFTSRKGILDLGDMPKGMYFIMVSDEAGVTKRKILLQ